MGKANNRKKLLTSLVLLFQLVGFASCSPMAQQMHRSNSGYFHYDYGDSWGTHGEFWIWTEDDVTYFEASAIGDDIYVDVFAEVEGTVFDEITEVILANQIDLWDGFSKRNPNVLDGSGFSLDFDYATYSVHAEAYVFEPENYQAGHEALLDFLCEYAESLPVNIPPSDSVGYIRVGTKDFQFDLLFGQYDRHHPWVYETGIGKRIADSFHDWDFYTFLVKSYDSQTPTSEDESYVEFDNASAQQILDKTMELITTNEILDYRTNVVAYVWIQYEGLRIRGRHSCSVALSEENQEWFTKMMLSVIGLPDEFDLNTLFDTESR